MAEGFELGLLALLAAQLAGPGMIEERLFIECPCGVKLDRISLQRTYGPTVTVRCDACHQNINGHELCYHCPRGRTLAHSSGYFICESCSQGKAEEQVKKDEENAPKLPDPLKSVRCRCGGQMNFIPVRLKYRAACKCDECGDAVPRLSYIYHCPKDRSDEHRTAHRLFDYCFACAYKKNPCLANSSSEPNRLQLILASSVRPHPWLDSDEKIEEMIREGTGGEGNGDAPPTDESKSESKSASADNASAATTTADANNADLAASSSSSSSVATSTSTATNATTSTTASQQTGPSSTDLALQLYALQQTLKKKLTEIDSLKQELRFLRETTKDSSQNANRDSAAEEKTMKPNPSKLKDTETIKDAKPPRTMVLDAILESKLSRLGLPSGRANAGNHVNEIANELVTLSARQAQALQWLSSGEIKNKKEQAETKANSSNENSGVMINGNGGIWDHVSLQSLQTMYDKLDMLQKQCGETTSQVAVLKTTCLKYISKKQDDWENWNSDEVVDWISAIENNRFSKYDNHLREVLNRQRFAGKDMKTLKFDALSDLGIDDYDDADVLMNSIEKLVKIGPTPSPGL